MSKLRELEKRLEQEPDNLVLRVTVAGALREAGRQAEAVELYRSVAIAYRDQGRSQQAIAVCRSILEIAPGDERCLALLASLVAPHPDGGEVEGATAPGEKTRERPPSVAPVAAGTSPGNIAIARTRSPRAPTAPPASVKAGVSIPLPGRKTPPPRRSSLDETPLPQPLPYHVADPTTRNLAKLSEVDLVPTPDPDAETRPGEPTRAGVKGIANAARRISGALIGIPQDDLSLELDTRQRPRIESAELAKITQPPPTVPIERLDVIEVDDDAVTAPPSITKNLRAPERDVDTEDDDGVPTLTDEEADEPTRPRDIPLDVMIRTETEGPLGSALFQPLPPDRRAAVLARCHKKTVKKGTTVIRQAEVGHSLVVVVRGALDLRVGAIAIGVVGTGEFIGEGSLLARGPSPVHVVAQTDCELLLLGPRDFYEIAGAFPALWAELKDVAERRKRERDAILRRASP